MKRIVFAIPSYHRSDRQPFLKYLHSLGVPRDDIYITIQNDEDRKAYAKWEPFCNIVGENGVGISFNRNQCLRVAPEARLVMCDDGIHALFVKQPNGRCEKVATRQRLMEMLDKMFAYCETHGVSVFSANNSSMGLCASGVDFIDHPFVSIFQGVVDRRVQFDNGVKFLEDVERNLRVLKGGGHTYRFAYVFPAVNHGAEGGQCAMHKDPRVDAFYKRLLAKCHPSRVSLSEKDGKCRITVSRKTYRKVRGVLFGRI